MAKTVRSNKGVAALLAILVSLMAFTGATIIALQVRHDMRTAQLGAKQASRRMAVKGAVNHLLSMLRRGEGSQYVEDSPLKLSVGSVEEVAVWTVPDPIFPGIRHIRAEVSGIQFTKTVMDKPVRESKQFYEWDSVLYSRKPGDPSWSTLPPPPTDAYDSQGQSVILEFPPANRLRAATPPIFIQSSRAWFTTRPGRLMM